MKKILALILALLIGVLCAACSGNTGTETTVTTETTATITETTERETTTDISQSAGSDDTTTETETTEKTTIVVNADVPEYSLSGELEKTENINERTVKKTYTGVAKQDFVAYTELLLASGFKLKFSTFWIVEGTSALPEYELGNTSIVISWNRETVVKGQMTVTITRTDVDKMYQ